MKKLKLSTNTNIKLSSIYIDDNFQLSHKTKDLYQPKWYHLFIKFLFPLFPIRIRNCIYLLSFLAILITLRLILTYISIPISFFGFNISFGWFPVYVCGFFFGPIVGLIFGAAMDSIVAAITGSVWFWLYAIQEPIIGFISGIMGGFYLLNIIKKLSIQVFMQKLLIYLFSLFTIFIIVYQFYLIDTKFSKGGLININIFAIIAIVFIIIYLIVNEVQSYLMLRKAKRYNQFSSFSLYLYISSLVIVVTVIFSFLLGPISFVKYTEFVNGSTPNSFIEYGSMYYLVPRVLKESIKTPIYIILLVGIINAIKTPFRNIINLNLKHW